MAQQIVIEVPGTKISELEPTSSVSASDFLPVVQDEETKRAPLEQISELVKKGLGSAALKNASEFATPASVTSVNQASQLRDDAQNERIDSVEHGLVSIGNGADASFNTYAEMLNYLPPKANVSVRNNDPDPALRGTYIWNGTGYVRGYDPIDYIQQAESNSKNYTDQKINTVFKRSINIFDKSKIEKDKYYNYQNGLKGTVVGFVAAGLYEIKPDTEYQVPNPHGQQIAFFGKALNYISGIANTGPTKKFTTPSNAAYIGITVEQSIVDIMMLCESSVYPANYVPFEVQIEDLIINTDKVVNLQEKLDGVLEPLAPYFINILTNAEVKAGYYINWFDGSIGPVAKHNVVGPCKIFPNTTYQTSSGYEQQWAYTDKDGKYVGGQVKPAASNTFTTPANARYATFTVPDAMLNTLVIAEIDLFEDASRDPTGGLRNLLVRSDQVSGLNLFLNDGLGLRSLNIIDHSKLVDGKYVDYRSGGLANNPDYVAAGPYEIKPNTEYQTSPFYSQQYAIYNDGMEYLMGLPLPPANKKFTTPANAKYIRMTVHKSILDSLVVAESEIFPEVYVSSEKKFAANVFANPVVKGVKNTEIWVSADLNDTEAAFKGANAVQLALNSIKDANEFNRYTIRAKKGLYKVDKAVDFIGYLGYPAMIEAKDYIDVVGQGIDNTIFWAELPYNDADIGPSFDGNTYPRSQYQTIYNFAKEAKFKDLTFIAKNLRYTLHQDNPRGANTNHYYENVGMIFIGDKGSLNSLGIGTWENEHTYFKGGKSVADIGVPFACHNNIAFKKPSSWSFESYNMTSVSGKTAIFLQSDGSLLQDRLSLVGVSFGGAAYIFQYVDIWLTGNTALNRDSFNHAEWSVSGHGNEPFLFKNTIQDGQCLRFKSKSVGRNVTIRIDKTSSAYPILIKSNQGNADAAIYTNNREFIDGYIVQDGSLGLPALAFGCKDLSAVVYQYDGLNTPSAINYTSFAKRLGDCTESNKILNVTINGTLNTIKFDKDYTSMSNAQVLLDINAQLTNGTADLYVYGQEYYPEISDVMEIMYNYNPDASSQAYIPKGSLVTKYKGSAKIATGNDKIYGVALEDIPVTYADATGVRKGQGRVMKRGYIQADRANAHFVLADNQNPDIGTKFIVSNGRLITDVNGLIGVDIDAGVISINC
ncbi:hypothetical protein [Acinetobacter junii]|uniref:hypothetical protein n=1 Tax=Acinetobacter junii TaxID=40215 RepID=UPI001D197FC6|nr:hypothetical protein [Acinetobacter junii]